MFDKPTTLPCVTFVEHLAILTQKCYSYNNIAILLVQPDRRSDGHGEMLQQGIADVAVAETEAVLVQIGLKVGFR